MPKVISRSGGVPQVTRGGAKFGQVFSYLDKHGNVKKEQLAILGGSDRLYSVKTSNGELSSAPLKNGKKAGAIVGSFKVVIEYFKDQKDYHKDFRAQLRIGDAYRVTKNGPTYVHLGQLNDGRYFALNIDSKDYATTSTAEKEVFVVGFAQFDVKTV